MCVLSTVLILWDLTLLCSANGSLSSWNNLQPSQVEFQSMDFRNVLHWKAHAGAPEDLRYFVQYKVYGDQRWTASENCHGTQTLQCDLSQETADSRQWYYARVQSGSAAGFSTWVVSGRFNPQWDTSFSPPQIRLNVTEHGVVVRIRPARTPAQGETNGRVSVTKLQRLTFRIYISHNKEREETHDIKGCTRKFLLTPIEPGSTYCVQAVTVVLLSGRESSRSPSSCVTTL